MRRGLPAAFLLALAALAGLSACSPGADQPPPPETRVHAATEEDAPAAAPSPPGTTEGESSRIVPGDPASRRFALVFGNGGYRHGDALPAARRDAQLIAKALRERGYHVVLGLDRGLAGMREDLDAFADLSVGAEVRVVYFAGHGFEFGHDNYLMPVDLPAPISALDAQAVRVNALRLEDVAWPLEQEGGVVIAIIDACRVGPTRGAASARALGELASPEGTILAYATAPGATAADSLRAYGVDQDHSPYTYFLAGALANPAISTWDQALLSAASIVRTQTGGAQTPWMNAAVDAFPAIGEGAARRGAGSGGALAGLASDISPERLAAGRYWADHEFRIARIAGDPQVFDDELQAAAAAGDETAALALAYRWSDRPGKERSAITLLEPLAERGNAVAQLTLGTLLQAIPARDGKGRKADYWWRQASANGVGEARAKLAFRQGGADMAALEEFAKGVIEIHSARRPDTPSEDTTGKGAE